MKIPLSYNLRNLVARKGTTLMTAVGIALTVAVLVVTLALVNGLRATFAGTGHPLQALVLRTGVTSELNSNISEPAFNEIRTMPGLATTGDGKPMASAEMVSVINLPSVDSPDGMNVTVRGLGPIGVAMREDVKVVAGRAFTPGLREVVVGASVAKRYEAASKIGGTLNFGRGQWEIVGVMSGGKASAINSEIWADVDQLQSDFDRQGAVSAVLVRLPSEAAVKDFATQIKDNQRLVAHAMPEREYYARMTSSSNGQFLQIVGTFVAVIMAIGSGFGAMNTMYAAVARRTREIGTLRALGFSRRSILTSFLIESVLLALVGGILGVLLALPMNNVTTGVGNWETFSEIAFNFRVSPQAIAIGLTFAVVIGALGGLLPAGSAARKDPLTAMREP
jgi:ABC-type antimicrobial peptide transport system permease subunit